MLSKKNKSKLLVISIATALSAVSSQVALSIDSGLPGVHDVKGDAFLYGENIQVGIHKNGAFGSETKSTMAPYTEDDSEKIGFISDPSGASFGGDFDGDFFMPGVPEAGWGVLYKGEVYHNNRHDYGDDEDAPIYTTPIEGVLKEYRKVEDGQEVEVDLVTWSGGINNELLIRQDYGIYKKGLSVTINIELKNNTSAVMKDVYYMSTLDPDNNFDSGGSSQKLSTVNTIHSQGDNSGVAMISAKQARKGDNGKSTLKLIGYGANARVATGGKYVRSPVEVYTAVALHTNTKQDNNILNSAIDNEYDNDESISIAFKYAEIKPGETVKIKYVMQLSDLNPPTLTLDENDSSNAGMGSAYKTIYMSEGVGVSIADVGESDSKITSESDNLKGLEVNLVTAYPNDVLIQAGSLPHGIKLVEDPKNLSTTKLVFMGDATIEKYKEVLESVVFKNTGVSPSLDERTVAVSVIDSDFILSNVAQAFIGVVEPVHIGASITADNIVNNKEEIDKVGPSGTATPDLPIKLIFTDKKSGSTPIEVIVPVAKNINGVWSSDSVDISMLEDGEITLVAMTEDAKGYKSSDEKKFTKNTAIEDITITSPAKDEVIKSIAPTITGTADPKSDVVMIINNDNKCETKAGDDGKWECAVSKLVLETEYAIDATSTNAVGSEVKTSSPFKTAPLTLEVTAPKDKSTVGAASFLVAGTSLPDANIIVKSGDKSCTVKADEKGDWSCEIKDLPTGLNKLTVEAIGADNVAKKLANLEVTVPNIPLIITSPAQDELIESNKVPVTGTTDPKATVTVSTGVEGEECTTIADAKGEWGCSFDVKEASEDKTLNVISKLADNGDKNSTVKIKLPSILSIEAPKDNDTVGSVSPLIVGKSLPNADIEVIGENGEKCTAKADANGNWSCTIPGLPSGPQKLDIKVKTPDGLEAKDSINITVPKVPLIVASPVQDELIESNKVPVTGTTDPNAKVTVSTGVDGETCTAIADDKGDWSCSFDIKEVSENKTLNVISKLADESEKNTTVEIKLPSILSLEAPKDNDTVANDSPLIVGKSLPNADIEVIGENGKKCTTKADANGNWSCTIQGLPLGAQKLDVKVKTPNGLEAMETINITVPSTPLLVTYPPEDELVTTDTVKTVGTTDPGAKVTVSTGVEGETCTTTANSEGKWECSFEVVTYTPTKLLSIKSELDGKIKTGSKGLRLEVGGEKENESGVTTVLKGSGSTSPLALLLMGLGLMLMRKLRKAK